MSEIEYYENRAHSTGAIPYSYYESKIPDYFPNVPAHWHSEPEINRIVSGTGEFICADEHYILSKGDIIIIPPDALHAVYPGSSELLLYDTLVFNSSMLHSGMGERSYNELFLPFFTGGLTIEPKICRNNKIYDELVKITDNIFRYAKSGETADDIMLKGELLLFFGTLFKAREYMTAAAPTRRLSDIIRPALEYINANYKRSITISELAAEAHISESYLMSVFRKTLGISAIEYICQLRLKTACELLLSTDLSVAEAAYECGFTNLSNFNRQFKSKLGSTPKAYRENNQSQKEHYSHI